MPSSTEWYQHHKTIMPLALCLATMLIILLKLQLKLTVQRESILTPGFLPDVVVRKERKLNKNSKVHKKVLKS